MFHSPFFQRFVDLRFGKRGIVPKPIPYPVPAGARFPVEFVLLSKPHGYWRWFNQTAACTGFKKGMWVETGKRAHGVVVIIKNRDVHCKSRRLRHFRSLTQPAPVKKGKTE
jgi:hypothetical protein